MYRGTEDIGRWRIDNGSLLVTDSSGESVRFSQEINKLELTETRFVLSGHRGKALLIKLHRWKSMTDEEILAYHEECEALSVKGRSK